MASPTLPPLLHLLPPELLDTILSHLSSPRDLLSFALASRACAHLVVPAHTQYRVLRVRTPLPALWAHLARRKDLAGNVRELWMCRRGEREVRERVPGALRVVGVGAGAGGAGVHARSTDSYGYGQPEGREAIGLRAGEEVRMRDVCVAVGNMTGLTTFVWEYEPDVKAGLRLNRAFEEGVLRALVRAAVGLRRLALRGQCAAHVREGRGVRGGWYPVWEMKGLESISLLGTGWIEKSNTPYVVHMLRRSPNLESLEIPTELPSHSTLSQHHFPHLKRLKFTMVSGALTSPTPSPSTSTGFPNPSTEDLITSFLEAHPTLEELNWTPLRALTLSPTALPALRRLKGARQVIDAFEAVAYAPDQDQDQDRIEEAGYGEAQPALARPIECLDIWGLNASRIARSPALDPGTLSKVRVTHVGHGAGHDPRLDLEQLEGMYAMAGRFRGVTWLGVFGDLEGVIGLADWLTLLPSFPVLEVFRGPGLWNAVECDKERMHGVILELVRRCPGLRQLDHCEGEVYGGKTGGVKVVRIFREEVVEEEGFGEGEVGRVWYEVWKPLSSRDLFDTMGGTFD